VRILQTASAFLFVALLASALTPRTVVAQDDGPSQQDKAMHYSLYFENLKNENFADARSDLRWILDNAPGFPKGDDRNYERAVDLYAGLAKQAEDENKQRAYIDTAATFLRTAPEKMEAAGVEYDPYAWEIEKGRFLQMYGSMVPDEVEGLKSAAYHYEQAFSLAPDRIDPYYINQVIQNYAKQNKQQEALDFMDAVQSKRGDDEDVQKILSSARSDIFGKNPQARIDFLKKKLENNPGDLQTQKELFNVLTDEGYIQEASQMAEKLLESDSLSANTYRSIAEMQLKDGRPTDAFSTYEKALDAGADLTAEDYFNMGTAKRRAGQLAQARRYYREAINLKSDFGRAYLAIGDVYVSAVSECGGSKMSRQDKAVYWLALDMYQRAKQVNPDLASTANNNIRTYSQYMPSQEDIFYVDEWKVGESVRIDYGCYSWINETTTVRKPS
jgi:tetratricopeptide (TPR) repeat protein